MTTSKSHLIMRSLLTKVSNKNTNPLKLETLLYLMKSVDLRPIRLDLRPQSYPKKLPLNLLDKILTLLSKIELMLLMSPTWLNSKTCNLVTNFKLLINIIRFSSNKLCQDKLLFNSKMLFNSKLCTILNFKTHWWD